MHVILFFLKNAYFLKFYAEMNTHQMLPCFTALFIM